MPGAAMRKLMLLLIAFIAVVTFIRAFDRAGAEVIDELPRQPVVEAAAGN